MKEKYEKIITITICFFVIALTFKMLFTPDSTKDIDVPFITYKDFNDDDFQLGIDTSRNDGHMVKSIVSFLRMIYDPIDANDTVTIEKSNNTIFVNHSSPENWSKIVGLEYVNYTKSKLQYFTITEELIVNDTDFSLSISMKKPIYESVYSGRQWVIEIEDNSWYVNRFIDGNYTYCPLVIDMELLLG